jgi:alginate O-acetyltransferase complex protein AlgJ
VTHAADFTPVISGKNDWLFISYEFANTSDVRDTEATIQLLQKVSGLFERRGIALLMVLVPSKIRIYSDQLPETRALDEYTAGKYESVFKALQGAGVNVVNLNQAFLTSKHRASDTPLFLRLDTHWAPSGALLAAETVKATIEASPVLRLALAATPEVKYNLTWAKRKVNHRARDLVDLLPKDAPSFASEQILLFSATRAQSTQASLLGAGDVIGITAIGSSYTDKNTGYPDGLRYTLQRDLLDISIPVTQGPWVGMETYLNDDAFKKNKPNLIIWEIPEREMRAPPNYKFRETRYISDNNQWLSRISGLLK